MKTTYEKPVVLANDETAEGVYAASGAASADNAGNGAADNASNQAGSYSLKQTNAWDGNKQYDITLKNDSDEHVDSVSVVLSVKGDVKTIGGNVSGTVSGTKAAVTSNNYGNGFDAHTSVTFYMAVTGTGDFSLE